MWQCWSFYSKVVFTNSLSLTLKDEILNQLAYGICFYCLTVLGRDHIANRGSSLCQCVLFGNLLIKNWKKIVMITD